MMSEGEYGAHNAGVAGSSPAPAIPQDASEVVMREAVTRATLPSALLAVCAQGSKSGSNPLTLRGAGASVGGPDVSLSQRPGDFAFVLWTTDAEGTPRILRTIYAPTRAEAQRHFGPQRDTHSVSSLVSYRTMGKFPEPPRDDWDGSGKVAVKVTNMTFHRRKVGGTSSLKGRPRAKRSA